MSQGSICVHGATREDRSLGKFGSLPRFTGGCRKWVGDYGLCLEHTEALQRALDVAKAGLTAAQAEAEALRGALAFYARHEHWMATGEASDLPRTLLVACGPMRDPNGWAEAEAALKEPA